MGKEFGEKKLKDLIQMRIDVLKARQSLVGMGGIIEEFQKDYPEFLELSDSKIRNMLAGNIGIKDKRFRDCFCSFADEIKKN